MKKATDFPEIWKEYLKENSSWAELTLYMKINIVKGPLVFNEGECPSHNFSSKQEKIITIH